MIALLLLSLAHDLQTTIEAEAKVKKGSPVTFTFTMTNNGKTSLFVLEWYTPFEGMKGDLFDVTKDGVALTYAGPMVKRVEPIQRNYFEVKPGESRKTTIKLSEGYDVSAPGTYKIAYTSRSRVDVCDDGTKIPRFTNPKQTPAIVSNTITVVVEP